ncbi:MAG TPA: NUDIX domain-containing protein [Jatrophihabitantaceae bacterium]
MTTDAAPQRSRVSAYGVATDQGRLLVVRLAESSPIFEPGLWHLPGGGIDPGEQPAEALAREFAEETGLTVQTAELMDARSYAAQRLDINWQLIALFYRVGLESADGIVSEVEGTTDAATWLPLADLHDEALSPAARDAVRLMQHA